MNSLWSCGLNKQSEKLNKIEEKNNKNPFFPNKSLSTSALVAVELRRVLLSLSPDRNKS